MRKALRAKQNEVRKLTSKGWCFAPAFWRSINVVKTVEANQVNSLWANPLSSIIPVMIVVTITISTASIATALEAGLFRIVALWKVYPRPGSWIWIAPVAIVVVVIISMLKVIWLCLQHHDWRQCWRHNHSMVICGSNHARTEYKRRERRKNEHPVHINSLWAAHQVMIASPAPAGASNLRATSINWILDACSRPVCTITYITLDLIKVGLKARFGQVLSWCVAL